MLNGPLSSHTMFWKVASPTWKNNINLREVFFAHQPWSPCHSKGLLPCLHPTVHSKCLQAFVETTGEFVQKQPGETLFPMNLVAVYSMEIYQISCNIKETKTDYCGEVGRGGRSTCNKRTYVSLYSIYICTRIHTYSNDCHSGHLRYVHLLKGSCYEKSILWKR